LFFAIFCFVLTSEKTASAKLRGES